MDDRTITLEKIARSEAAVRPDAAALLGLWHFEKKEYPAAFLAFSTAVSSQPRFGFWAVAAWRSEWGANPLPADFVAKAPLPSACFWAWTGKPDEGLAALKKAGTVAEKIHSFLEVYLKLLSLPPGPSSRPAEFRERLEELIREEYGVSSDRTRNLLALYDAGNLDFACISEALSELEHFPDSPGWKAQKSAAGQLLFYFFLLRAGLESFEKALKINPNFSKAVKNTHLVKKEKLELVELLKQFRVL